MRDGPFHSAVKRVLARAYLRDVDRRRARAARRGQLHWELAGACEGCGSCCEAPTIQVGSMMFFLPLVSRVWLWWQRVVNGFIVVDRLREERAFVFRCTHFDPATRKCDSYDARPGMCRDYPRMQLEAPMPELFDRCGHKVVAKGGAQMIEALRARGIEGEQLVQITTRLKLR